MGRRLVFRGVALGVGLLLSPLLSGCFVPVGAAWPSVSVTPLLQVNATGGQVRAFRVDSSTSHGGIEFSGENEYVLSEVPVSSGGLVSPQGNVGCDYFWYCNFIALSYGQVKHHSTLVRLYRPGCQTVEVASWNLPHEVAWRGVADLAGQEKSLDDLLATGTANIFREWAVRDADPSREDYAERLFGGLAPGSKSPEHRKVLVFAASEYERLAKTAPESAAGQAIRDRLKRKAEWLRERAGK
jgi:hypothetical protein